MEKEKEWYDDPDIITIILTGVLVLILIVSQSFAIRNHMDLAYVFRSLFNYNSIYIVFLAYFILLKTDVGKRYFNLMNLILTGIMALLSFGSLLNVIHTFQLESLVSFIQNIVLFLYMSYVLLPHSKAYRALGFDHIPFHEVKNDYYFYGISGIILVSMVLSLIGTQEFTTVLLTLLDATFYIGVVRFLYLYRNYEDQKEKAEEILVTPVFEPAQKDIVVVKKKEASSKKEATVTKDKKTTPKKKSPTKKITKKEEITGE